MVKVYLFNLITTFVELWHMFPISVNTFERQLLFIAFINFINFQSMNFNFEKLNQIALKLKIFIKFKILFIIFVLNFINLTEMQSIYFEETEKKKMRNKHQNVGDSKNYKFTNELKTQKKPYARKIGNQFYPWHQEQSNRSNKKQFRTQKQVNKFKEQGFCKAQKEQSKQLLKLAIDCSEQTYQVHDQAENESVKSKNLKYHQFPLQLGQNFTLSTSNGVKRLSGQQVQFPTRLGQISEIQCEQGQLFLQQKSRDSKTSIYTFGQVSTNERAIYYRGIGQSQLWIQVQEQKEGVRQPMSTSNAQALVFKLKHRQYRFAPQRVSPGVLCQNSPRGTSGLNGRPKFQAPKRSNPLLSLTYQQYQARNSSPQQYELFRVLNDVSFMRFYNEHYLQPQIHQYEQQMNYYALKMLRDKAIEYMSTAIISELLQLLKDIENIAEEAQERIAEYRETIQGKEEIIQGKEEVTNEGYFTQLQQTADQARQKQQLINNECRQEGGSQQSGGDRNQESLQNNLLIQNQQQPNCQSQSLYQQQLPLPFLSDQTYQLQQLQQTIAAQKQLSNVHAQQKNELLQIKQNLAMEQQTQEMQLRQIVELVLYQQDSLRRMTTGNQLRENRFSKMRQTNQKMFIEYFQNYFDCMYLIFAIDYRNAIKQLKTVRRQNKGDISRNRTPQQQQEQLQQIYTQFLTQSSNSLTKGPQTNSDTQILQNISLIPYQQKLDKYIRIYFCLKIEQHSIMSSSGGTYKDSLQYFWELLDSNSYHSKKIKQDLLAFDKQFIPNCNQIVGYLIQELYINNLWQQNQRSSLQEHKGEFHIQGQGQGLERQEYSKDSVSSVQTFVVRSKRERGNCNQVQIMVKILTSIGIIPQTAQKKPNCMYNKAQKEPHQSGQPDNQGKYHKTEQDKRKRLTQLTERLLQQVA